MTRVFVYGTLQSGERNHFLIRPGAFVRAARSEAAFTLYSFGGYPGLVPGGTTAVMGEVYDVDEATLLDLDALEEYPEFYDRQPIRLEDGEEVLAYTLREDQVAGLTVIPSGDWKRPN